MNPGSGSFYGKDLFKGDENNMSDAEEFLRELLEEEGYERICDRIDEVLIDGMKGTKGTEDDE
jgi:hypothetical protein